MKQEANSAGAKPDPNAVHEMMMKISATGPQHQGLARFAGRWKAHVKFWMDPSAPPSESTGIMVNTMVLGGRFLHHDYQADSGMLQGQGYWGYNTIDERYEGFWLDTMATFFQLDRGQLDAKSDTYHMSGTMTDPMTRNVVKKRSEIAYKNSDEHTMTMFFEREGREIRQMEIRYTRA